MTELVLYHYWRSSASWRVRWALELKKISFMSKPIDLRQAEEKSPAFLQCNPAGYVPCLVTQDGPIGESVAIIEWLDESFPQNPLLPSQSYSRAKHRQLAESINSGAQPLQNLDVTRRLSSDEKVQLAWNQHWIGRGLAVYEGLLKQSRSDLGLNDDLEFSLSNTPSFPDLFLVPQCYSALRFGVDLEEFAICQGIYERALQTFECAASHPDRYQN